MNIEELAKIIYISHQEEDELTAGMERGWHNLLYKRSYSDPYTVSQKEYIDMAEGIAKHLGLTLE
jgi:hypothetical protein